MDIVHKIPIHAPREEVFRAIRDESLLHTWWKNELSVTVRVVECHDGSRVSWRCVDGPDEWIGTDVTFDLRHEGSETMLRFGHRNWKAATDLMAHASTKWARLLLGLKSRLRDPGTRRSPRLIEHRIEPPIGHEAAKRLAARKNRTHVASVIARAFALAVAAGTLGACAGEGPRDIPWNKNPKSVFAEPRGTAASASPPGDSKQPEPKGQGARSVAKPEVLGSRPRVLVRANTRSLATHATQVYYGDAESDELCMISKAGGEPTRLARRAPTTGALAIDGDAMAWIGSPGDAVFRMAQGSDKPTLLLNRAIFSDLAADRGDVFVTEAAGAGGTLMRLTGATTAATATSLGSFEGTPRAIVVDAAHAYVITSSAIFGMSRQSKDTRLLVRGADLANAAIDEHYVYVTAVTRAKSRDLVRIKKVDGSSETLERGVRNAPIAVHRNEVFYFHGTQPSLLARSTRGGNARVVTGDPSFVSPAALAVDDDGVYVATGDGGTGAILTAPSRP